MAKPKVYPSTQESQANRIILLASADFKTRIKAAAETAGVGLQTFIRENLEQAMLQQKKQ